MVLIVGGAAQGKLAFARRELGVTVWSDGIIDKENCLYNLHRALRDQPEAETLLERWLTDHPDGVVICDEVGCGVVPVDPAQRARREQVGRLCCRLAKRAERVERIFCGLPMVLKGEGPWN